LSKQELAVHAIHRPPLETVDIEDAKPPVSSGTPWEQRPSQPDVIDRASFFDAIKPNSARLDDFVARQLEGPLLDEPQDPPDTLPPPPFVLVSSAPPPRSSMSGWSSGRTSGVRPIGQRPPQQAEGQSPQQSQTPQVMLAVSDDLQGHQLTRARMMVRATAVVSVIGTILLQVVAPSFDLHHVLATTALIAALGMALWIEVVIALYASASHRHHLALGIVALTAMLVVLAHGGLASPVALFAVLLAHHYAGTRRRNTALSIVTFAAAGVLTIGALSGLGVLSPIGPFVTRAPATLAWAGSIALFVVLAGYLSWHRMGRIVNLSERAIARVSRREALLDEAYAFIGTQRTAREGRRTGERLGRYHLEQVIGRSHRSEVYSASTSAGQRAAVKLFEPGASRGRIARIFSRASAANTVTPGAMGVLDQGYLADGGFFIVMEMLSGMDLGQHLREPWSMSNTESLLLLDELASALARAHEAKVFHGDIKPENIIRDARGHWRLTDFDTPATALDQSVPAPRYTAPEHGRAPLDARMDVFSLAAIAYRLLIRCPPLCDSDPFETGASHRPVRPSALAPVHADVDAIFGLAMATDTRVRMDSPLAFSRALRLAIDGALPEWQRDRAQKVLAFEPFAEPTKCD
jgi:hypothetical protein